MNRIIQNTYFISKFGDTMISIKNSFSLIRRAYTLPSVSLLISRHQIPQNIVDSIKPSGPRNNLIKGDILAYLQSPSSAQMISPPAKHHVVASESSGTFIEKDLPITPELVFKYYTKQIDIEKCLYSAKVKKVSLSDLMISIYSSAIPERISCSSFNNFRIRAWCCKRY